MKLEPLVEALKCVFSEFGGVVDIVAKKNVRARGQAFIVFDNKDEAENAIGELHGFNLFGKPLKLCMARTRSDKTIEMRCTGNELAEHKRHRQAEKGENGNMPYAFTCLILISYDSRQTQSYRSCSGGEKFEERRTRRNG